MQFYGKSSSIRQKIYTLAMLLMVLTFIKYAEALIQVPVAQQSSILPYNPALQYTHAYFDINFNVAGSQIQNDNNFTYFFSRTSPRSVDGFQFVKTNNTDMTTQIANKSIVLPGYQIFGMCQFNGSLDYVVGQDTNSNELRVIRFVYDGQNDKSTVLDYKVVDRDPHQIVLTGNVYIDCAYINTFNGINTYVIALAGTYFSNNGLTSYYFAKFSTKYNMTEYFVQSQAVNVMEQVRGVKVDKSNEMLYLALEVNKNKYNGRTVYAPGTLPGNDNANVAILGYSWTFGVLEWTTVIGNPVYQDEFAGMDVWGNSLYVFTNSFSTQYSTNSSQTDIYYYRMRYQNGYIESFKIFGSPKDDKVYDVKTTFNGVYVLAIIDNYLLPHKYNDRVWVTQNYTSNIALIWIDFFDDILDIEAYSLDQAPNPYPTKLQVRRVNDHRNDFILYSHRDTSISGQNAGIFLTHFANSSLVLQQSILCTDPNCAFCSPQNLTQCVQCNSGLFLWKHHCYSNQCPTHSYSVYDYSLRQLHYCKDCHPSCKTCTGSRNDQCASCCLMDSCGSINNRVAGIGTCSCPAGLADSNGICVQRCVLNLAGKRQDMCYPQCPVDSFSDIKYDQPTPQERSQYDINSQADCQLFSNHLKFTQTGKGLPLNGPSYLQAMPSEFTIAFWVRPTALNIVSYFANVFGRVQIKAQGSNNQVQFVFATSASTTVEPIYSATASQRSVVIGAWNYISVAMRSPLGKYEMQMAISNSNTGAVMNSGYSNTQPFVYYPSFVNTIYLGSQSDSQPQSFTGYLKEFKMFNIFHGYAQMQVEQLRIYRLYSYDDPHLVAYWRLSETYSSADYQYTINDYSIYMNSIQYSQISEPDYPQYLQDQSNTLSLCTFHDVAICRSLDYSASHPYVASQSRLTQPPTFQLNDFSHIKQDGDQVWFTSNNSLCLNTNILAYMTYRGGLINDFVVEDPTMSPLQLLFGKHYQVCYYLISENQAFNLLQVYVMTQPTTINPQNSNSFLIAGAAVKWMATGGDQGYNEIIQFSEDCDNPQSTDFAMQRTYTPNYGTQSTTNFQAQGQFYYCWQSTYVMETNFPYFESIHSLKFSIVLTPTVDVRSISVANVNVDLIRFNFNGVFVDGDKLAFSWAGSPQADCRPSNFLGQQYTYNYSYWPSIWFGQNSGIYGVQNRTMDTLHVCYLSQAINAPGSWVRVKLDTQDTYDIKIQQFNSMPNTKCPELLSFIPRYGSTELYETDTAIIFNFLNQAVYPSRILDSPVTFGQIYIYRGAIYPDGTIQKTNQILWQQTALDDYHIPDPFQQGDLICTQTGQCSIILSTTSSRMKAGEIYFLSFMKNTFSSHSSTGNVFTRYYLFYNKTIPAGQVSAYDHLFFCRSFDITYSSQMINGNTFMINGIDLLSKNINAVASGAITATQLFTTKAINLKLSVLNTADDLCTASPPTATVIMSDATQTSIKIKNLALGQCNQGALFAEIELIRGIQDQYGQFTHLRAEQLKNIQLGLIGCDPSCLQCNGTSSNNCVICANPLYSLLMGTCYPSCPLNAPFYQTNILIFQKQKWQQQTCLKNCPFGTYPDPDTQECLSCNAECQTCQSSIIASCLSCAPIGYLYNGICVPNCPTPHHQNNLTTYTCDPISQSNSLSVQIESLGYKTRIPKTTQTYLKAAIVNDNVSQIINIKWTQIEPIPSSSLQVIFITKSDGNLDDSNAVAKLQMTAFNFMTSDQVIKVQCTVQNSFNEIAYDIYEFYLNDPPVKGNTTLDLITGSGNGSSFDSIYLMSLFGWLDARDGGFYSNIYISVDQIQYIVTDQTTDDFIYFRLPLFSSTATTKNISICIEAQDLDQGLTQYCEPMNNVSNNLNYVNNTNKLIQSLISLNYTSNLTNSIFAANALFFAIKAPVRDTSSPGICTMDFHCNFNGQCQAILGAQTCICNLGFQGSFCQYSGSQLQNLQNITHMIIMTISNKISPSYEINRFDIGSVGTILRGIQADPDILNDKDFQIVVQLNEAIAQASTYAHYPLNPKIRSIYLDSLSASYLKMYHSRKVQRAYSNVVGLGQGMTIEDQYNMINQVSTASSRRLTAEEYPIEPNNQEYMKRNSFPKKQNLIGKNIQGASYMSRNLELTAAESTSFQNYGRRMTSSINQFILKTLLNFSPDYSSYNYINKAFQLKANSGYSGAFKNIQVFIQELDVHWNIPGAIFDNSQGTASNTQYINMLAMKWVANPFLFETNPGAFVESNVTTFSFLDTSANHINLTFPPGVFIEIREAWNQTQSYDMNSLRCMAWNDSSNQFNNDASCAFSLIWDILPCLTCASNEVYNTTVALCRCSHLSTFAAAYEQTVVNSGSGPQIGLYSNFFALEYWRNSFGYYLVLVGIAVYTIGMIVMYLVDRKLQPVMLAKLRDKIRRLELRGFKQIEDYEIEKAEIKVEEKLGIIPVQEPNEGPLFEGSPSGKTKGKIEDEVEEFKWNNQGGQVAHLPQAQRYDDAPTQPAAGKKVMAGGKKLMPKKTLQKDVDSLNSSQRNILLPAKGKKLPNKQRFGQVVAGDNLKPEPTKNLEKDHHLTDEEAMNDEQALNTEEARDVLDKEMKRRYEEEVKSRKDGLIQLTGEDEEESELSMIEKQKRYRQMEAKKFEKHFYKLKTMMIHGSALANIVYVTSIITPRHVRWTQFFVNVILICFWCAVIYNNTQNPLTLPDKNRKARNVAYQDLWISVVSPIGSIILMYVFAGLFKISDARINKSFTSVYFERMMFELKKEMKLRYILAYFITVGFFGACCYYIINFSSTFGWKTSWTWWYACVFAFIIQFLIFDPLIIMTHWIVYKCSRQFALFIMRIRWLKQTKSEIE